jgi:hypothetical protein
MSDTENVSEIDSREKTKKWLEDILQTYYSKVVEKGGEEKKSRDEVPITILDFDIGPGLSVGESRLSTLSDLLSLYVRYKVIRSFSPFLRLLILWCNIIWDLFCLLCRLGMTLKKRLKTCW